MGYPLAYRLIIDSTGVAVLLLNLVVLPAVLYCNKWILPSFKLIMMVFSLTNVTHYVLDVFALPRCIQLPGLTIAYSDGFISNQHPELGRVMMCFLLCLFCIQIFNESVHFLYRYILLCRPGQQHLLEIRTICFFLSVAVPLIGGYQFLVTYSSPSQDPDILSSIEDMVREGWDMSAIQLNGVVFQYWDTQNTFHWRGWLSIGLFFIPCLSFFGIMLYCGFKTHQTMNAVKESMSSATKRQNAVVFRMLVVQSVVPFVLLQLPGIFVFCGSMLFVLDKEIMDFLVMVILTCPALEPLIAIYFLSKGNVVKTFSRCLRRNRTSHLESTLATSGISHEH